MGTKQEKEYWTINDFQVHCDLKKRELGNLSEEFSNMLKELENSFKHWYGQSINLRKGFQENGRYVFDGRQPKDKTREMLYEVLEIWKNEKYKYYSLILLGRQLDKLMYFPCVDGENIIALLYAALDCFIAENICSCVGYGGGIIGEMITELKELHKKCVIGDKEKSYKIAISFVSMFYHFAGDYSGKVDGIKYFDEDEEESAIAIRIALPGLEG